MNEPSRQGTGTPLRIRLNSEDWTVALNNFARTLDKVKLGTFHVEVSKR
jgi:hypothetical protein